MGAPEFLFGVPRRARYCVPRTVLTLEKKGTDLETACRERRCGFKRPRPQRHAIACPTRDGLPPTLPPRAAAADGGCVLPAPPAPSAARAAAGGGPPSPSPAALPAGPGGSASR